MLKLKILLSESFDNSKAEFVQETFDLELEHSLVALSKWESKFEKAFLDAKEKTTEEVLDYIRCMILTPDYPPDILNKFTQENFDAVRDYIDAKMTASWVSEPKNPTGQSREKITSELIYFWLSSYSIDWQVQHWHLSRLFTLIRIHNAKNSNSKEKPKMTPNAAAQRRALNEQRRRQYNTTG